MACGVPATVLITVCVADWAVAVAGLAGFGVDVTGWKGVGVAGALGSCVTSRRARAEGGLLADAGRASAWMLQPAVVKRRTRKRRMRLIMSFNMYRP